MITQEIEDIRLDFPMLKSLVHEKPLIYFDSAATTFKPEAVIEAIAKTYESEYGTVHRAIYELSSKSSANYYRARKTIQSFIGASSEKEVIFTSGATAGLNMVALSFGEVFIEKGDEILITEIEHHSNLVPWQMLAERKKAHLKFIPILDTGDIDLEAFKALLGPKTKLVSLPHVSNAIGTTHPISEIAKLVRESSSAKILVDGAQAISHIPIDVKELDVDFYVFSAHKIFGPTGMGILYGKEALLEKMPPIFGGGDMIEKVTKEKTTYNKLPLKFEAGTPHMAGVMGLEAAILYLQSLGFDLIEKHEGELTEYAIKQLKKIPGLVILGSPKKRGPLISFYIEGIHNLDLATLLNFKGVAVRSGHLCAQTALERFNVPSMLRISFALYNTFTEIDSFILSLKEVILRLEN